MCVCVKVVKMADVREAKGVATESEVHRGGWESEGWGGGLGATGIAT